MRRLLALVVCATLAAGGCKTLGMPAKDAQEQGKRAPEVVRELDQRRDTAELLLARERFERGELDQARLTLGRIITRSPDNAEAKSLLAAVERTIQQAAQMPAVTPASANGLTGPTAERIGVDVAPPAAAGAASAASAAVAVQSENNGGSDVAGRIGSLLDAADTALREKTEPSLAVAMSRIQEARAVNPQDPQIALSAAGLLLRHNQPQAAIGLLREATAAFPTSAPVHRMLGTAYYRAGGYQDSQVAFQQALSLDKSSALSYFLMGCTLAKLGRTEEAAAHFRQAQMLDPRLAGGH